MTWIKESNRPKHVAYGLAFYAISLLFAFLVGLSLCQGSLMALVTVMEVAVTKEFTDHQHGSEFDVLDALATVLFPFCLTLLSIIVYLLWLF